MTNDGDIKFRQVMANYLFTFCKTNAQRLDMTCSLSRGPVLPSQKKAKAESSLLGEDVRHVPVRG